MVSGVLGLQPAASSRLDGGLSGAWEGFLPSNLRFFTDAGVWKRRISFLGGDFSRRAGSDTDRSEFSPTNC